MDPSTDHNNDIIGGGNSGGRPSETLPRLCIRGCGFFGTVENEWFCSKCYKMAAKGKKLLSEEKLLVTKPRDDHINENCISKPRDVSQNLEMMKNSGDGDDVINNIPRIVKKKNRCGSCNKKVGLLGFDCRCGVTFCGTHRYPEMHSCQFDYKEAGKITIEKENPLCKADKITDRI